MYPSFRHHFLLAAFGLEYEYLQCITSSSVTCRVYYFQLNLVLSNGAFAVELKGVYLFSHTNMYISQNVVYVYFQNVFLSDVINFKKVMLLSPPKQVFPIPLSNFSLF